MLLYIRSSQSVPRNTEKINIFICNKKSKQKIQCIQIQTKMVA